MNETKTNTNKEQAHVTCCRDEKIKESAILETRQQEEKLPSSIESLSKLGLLGDL